MKTTSPLFLLTTTLVLAACGGAPPYAADPIENDIEQFTNVTVSDAELKDVVRVGRSTVDRMPGSNQLRVMVPIRNVDDEPIQLLVQVSFLDGRQTPIGDDTNRQVQLIAPGATVNFTATSKFATAQDWQMRLSWNR